MDSPRMSFCQRRTIRRQTAVAGMDIPTLHSLFRRMKREVSQRSVSAEPTTHRENVHQNLQYQIVSAEPTTHRENVHQNLQCDRLWYPKEKQDKSTQCHFLLKIQIKTLKRKSKSYGDLPTRQNERELKKPVPVGMFAKMYMRIIMNQEPLGIMQDVVSVGDLRRWSEITPSNYLTDYSAIGEPPKHNISPFPYDSELNHKIILWSGDISTLQVDAIVNSTNESMTDSNPVSDRIYQRAGSNLKEEVSLDIRECRTGEVKVTKGHSLPARYIIHTVGPKYNIKYQTAAENTLHICYRNVLQKSRELGIHSIAMCVINSVKRNYPPDEGAHIALRTARRFLEHYGSSLDTLIFAVDNSDFGIYEVLLPLYFPRSKFEEDAARWQLPQDIGGVDGEPMIPDRQIRIIDNPQHTLHPDEESIDLSSQLDTSVNVGDHAFTQMQGDLDQQRLLGERTYNDPLADIMVKEIQHQERYERLLRRAKTEDLTEVSGIGCLYQSGVDRLGRPVVVFVGKWFPFNKINLDKALLYLIALLDPIVKGDYVIAYFHTLTSHNNYPSLSWLKEVYNVLPYKYKKNLKAFYIIHPTFWTKMMTWWFTTFMAPAIKQKVHSLQGVEYLYSVMSPDQLEIPAYITEYDMSINGLRYFQPSAAPT